MHAAVLRYFEAVAEDGSIRRASERLHISPSAVNRQILKIEDYFGTPLFERRPDGMRLTDAGQLVLRHSRETLQDFARLRGDIDNLRGIVSGVVTIATLDSLTVHFCRKHWPGSSPSIRRSRSGSWPPTPSRPCTPSPRATRIWA